MLVKIEKQELERLRIIEAAREFKEAVERTGTFTAITRLPNKATRARGAR